MSDRFLAGAMAVAFLLLTSLTVAVGFLGLNAMERLHDDAHRVADTQWEDVQLASEALDDSNRNSSIAMQTVFSPGGSEIHSLLAQQAENDARISELIVRLQNRIGSEEERQLLQAVIDARGACLENSRHAAGLMSNRKDVDARRQLFQEMLPRFTRYQMAWSDFINFQTSEMNQELRKSAIGYAADRKKTVLLMICAVLLAVAIGSIEVYKTAIEIRRRTAAEKTMRRMNEDLERIVVQRTAALDNSNHDLMAEIGRRTQVEENLVSKTAFLEAQANSTIDGILVVDAQNRKLFQNYRLIDLFRIPQSIVENHDDQALLAYVLSKVTDPEPFLQKVKYLYQHPKVVSRDQICLKDGTVLDRYSSPVVGADGTYYGRIWAFRDITEVKRAQDRIEFLAYYDALTNLPNRTLLQDRLAKAIAGARRRKDKLGLLYLDLDRFKIINDSLGHSIGDLLLQQVGERLKKWAREQDTVARVGGDEFILILNSVKEVGDAAVAAERLLDTLREAFSVQEHALSISCSIGISIFPEQGADAETLIKNADAAMYCAKESDRNNFKFYTEDMNIGAVERLTLENSLRQALPQQQLFLAYQPQMDVASQGLVGFEALLRWRHPELGLIPPDRFIRIAENGGLIVPIGEWVLRTACAQARKWQDEGLPAVPVAVNVSAVQFRQEHFVELIQKVLAETGLPAQFLELELTESLLLSNRDVILSVLRELREMGVQLSIDDFGTGYSSLSYLRQFPVSKLKIDRSFINHVATNPDDAAIAAAIISMGKNLNLKVIAEGVETEAQMSFLREHQCDEIQGYYYGKPLPADEITDQLRDLAAPAAAARQGMP